MKKLIDYYYKNYDKITISAVALLLLFSILSIVVQPLTYVVGAIVYSLMIITLCNLCVFYKDVTVFMNNIMEALEKMKN